MDDLGDWVMESFLAEGKTALPDSAYLMVGETRPINLNVPAKDEVRELFQDAEEFQKFLVGEDYSTSPWPSKTATHQENR